MALIHFSKKRQYAFLPEPESDVSPNLSDLLSYAYKLGLHMRGYKVEKKEEILSNNEYPLIIVVAESGPLHTVYLVKKKGNRFLVYDPSMGKRWIKTSDLVSIFTGVYLRVELYEERGDMPKPLQPPLVMAIPIKGIFALLPTVLVFLGILFTVIATPTCLALGFVGAGLTLGVIGKSMALRALSKFDDRYLHLTDSNNIAKRKKMYEHYQAYKRASVNDAPSLIFGGITFLALLVFILVTDLPLFLSIASGVAVALILEIVISMPIKRIETDAATAENRYLYTPMNIEERSRARGYLAEAASKYGRLLSVLDGGKIVIACAFAYVYALVFNDLGANSLLIKALSGYFFIAEAGKYLRIGSLIDAKKKESAYFVQHFLSTRVDMDGE